MTAATSVAAPLAAPHRDDRAAVDKAISLLVNFGAQAATGVGVSELARRAGMSKSTAFRVLGLLERNGVVDRVGREYRIGAQLQDLGRNSEVPGHDRVRDMLIPFLTDAYELTHQTAHLAMLQGTDVVYLAKLYGHRQVHSPSRIGGRLPAHCTAVGKVLLAHDPAAVDAALTNGLEHRTARTLTEPGQLNRELAAVRRGGVAFDREEAQTGLACVAMPILGLGGRPVAAISVSVPAGRIDPGGYVEGLRRIAADAAPAAARARLRALSEFRSAS